MKKLEDKKNKSNSSKPSNIQQLQHHDYEMLEDFVTKKYPEAAKALDLSAIYCYKKGLEDIFVSTSFRNAVDMLDIQTNKINKHINAYYPITLTKQQYRFKTPVWAFFLCQRYNFFITTCIFRQFCVTGYLVRGFKVMWPHATCL